MVRLLETIQTQLIGWIMCVPNPLYSYHIQMTLNDYMGRSDFGATGNSVYMCVCVCVCARVFWVEVEGTNYIFFRTDGPRNSLQLTLLSKFVLVTGFILQKRNISFVSRCRPLILNVREEHGTVI
jgi:hypothetical protein